MVPRSGACSSTAETSIGRLGALSRFHRARRILSRRALRRLVRNPRLHSQGARAVAARPWRRALAVQLVALPARPRDARFAHRTPLAERAQSRRIPQSPARSDLGFGIPGLPDHPPYARSKKYLKNGCGSDFDVRHQGGRRRRKFINNLEAVLAARERGRRQVARDPSRDDHAPATLVVQQLEAGITETPSVCRSASRTCATSSPTSASARRARHGARAQRHCGRHRLSSATSRSGRSRSRRRTLPEVVRRVSVYGEPRPDGSNVVLRHPRAHRLDRASRLVGGLAGPGNCSTPARWSSSASTRSAAATVRPARPRSRPTARATARAFRSSRSGTSCARTRRARDFGHRALRGRRRRIAGRIASARVGAASARRVATRVRHRRLRLVFARWASLSTRWRAKRFASPATARRPASSSLARSRCSPIRAKRSSPALRPHVRSQRR